MTLLDKKVVRSNKLLFILASALRTAAFLCSTGVLMQTFLSVLGFSEQEVYIHSTVLQAANVLTILIGARFADRGNIFKRAKALIPVLIPLLISSFRRADELADAMDSRCYSGSKVRTKYKKMKVGWRDLIGVLLITALIVGVVYLNKFYLVLTVA